MIVSSSPDVDQESPHPPSPAKRQKEDETLTGFPSIMTSSFAIPLQAKWPLILITRTG